MAASVTASVSLGDSASAIATLETASFTPTGANKVIYALVGGGATAPGSPTAVKYASAAGVGGESLTLLDSVRTVDTNIKTSVWQLVAPSAASGTIHATYASNNDERWIIAVAVQDSDGTIGPIAFGTATGSTAPTVNATTVAGDLVLDFLSVLQGSGGSPTLTVGAGQASVKELEGGTPATGSATNIGIFEAAGVSSETAAGASTTMSWTISGSASWGVHAFAVKGAAAAAASPSQTLSTSRNRPGRGPYSLGRYYRPIGETASQIISDVSYALTGVSATAQVGTLVASVQYALTGVQPAVSVGAVSSFVAYSMLGVAGTTGLGTVVPGVTYPLTGVQATVSVGTVTASVGTTLAITGVSATVSAGTVAPSIAYALTGLAATGAVGSVKASPSYGISSAIATAAVGTAVPGVTIALTGVASAVSVGSVSVAGTSRALTGVAPQILVGSLGASITVALSGVSASASVGTLRILAGAVLSAPPIGHRSQSSGRPAQTSASRPRTSTRRR